MSDHLSITDSAEFEQLISLGFSKDEATRLMYMKDHTSEEIEYRELLEETRRIGFIRWLVEHDRLTETLPLT